MSIDMTWSTDFAVDIDEIDDQHKTLFELVDQLHHAIREHRGSAACLQVLTELIEYTHVHFKLEESLMRMAGYPHLEQHKAQHADLIAEVTSLHERVAGGHAAVSFELLAFLRTWLIKHIKQSDTHYAAYFRKSEFGKFGGGQQDQADAPQQRKWWKLW